MKKYLLPILMLAATPAFAANCESMPEVKAYSCMEKASYIPVEQNYKRLIELTKTSFDDPSLTSSMSKELLASQSDWLKYRDSYCNSYSNYHGEKANHTNCLIMINTARADQLANDIEAAQ